MLSRFVDWVKNFPSLLRPRFGARRALGPSADRGGLAVPWLYNWTDDRVAMVRAFRGWTYIAVDRIATAVASKPPNVSLVRTAADPGKRERWIPEFGRQKALTPLLSHEQLELVPQNHPLCRLLTDPNEPDTAWDLWYQTTMFLCLTGTAYWWVPPNVAGKPAAVWCIPSSWVRPRVGRDGALCAFDLYPTEGPYMRYSLPAEDVIYFKRPSPLSMVDGYSALTAGSRWVDTSDSIDKSWWFTFKNGIFPGVGVEFDAGAKLPSEADLDRIETRLMQRYGGEHNTNRPILVPPGAKVRKLQLTPGELMFLESSEAMRDRILALFGVPAAIAQVDSGMTAGGILGAQTSFMMLTINPLLHFFGAHLTEKLAQPRYQQGLRVWWEDRTPQDPELLERQLNTDLAYCSRSPNELRSLRGLEPYPEEIYNRPWTPLNTLPVNEALEHHRRREGSPGSNRDTRNDPSNSPRGGEAPDLR